MISASTGTSQPHFQQYAISREKHFPYTTQFTDMLTSYNISIECKISQLQFYTLTHQKHALPECVNPKPFTT